jgi:CHAD domain-containing protein
MASVVQEIERKYAVGPGFQLPDLRAVPGVERIGDPTDADLDATYYDTSQLVLVRHRTTLRRRHGGSDEGWHLKQSEGEDRSETREPVAGSEVPESLADAVRELTGDTPLVPVARVRTHRREIPLCADGRVLAILSVDDVTGDALLDPPATSQWREVEVELVDGPRELLDAVEAVLTRAGAHPSSSPSKLAQTLGERIDRAGAPGALTAYLRAQRRTMSTNEPLVRAADPDGVHDMRVAVRRTRALLRTFRPLLDADRTEPLRAELGWLAGVLGAVRDREVQYERLTTRLDALDPADVVGPVRARLAAHFTTAISDAREALVDALDSDRYRALTHELETLVLPDPPAPRLRRRARKALRRADAALAYAQSLPRARTGVGLPGAATFDTALHEARKAYKRARYAVEVVAGGSGRGRRLGRRLSDLQDVLGDHQDGVIAVALLRDLGMRAHAAGENAFTYGVLHGWETHRAKRCLRDLPSLRRRIHRRKRRAVLD